MKKVFFLSMMLMAAVAMQAQLALKVAPQLKVGDKKVYASVTVNEVSGQKAVTVKSEEQYAVVEETADGYVVENTLLSAESDATDVMGRMMTLTGELFKGETVRVAVSKEGQVQQVLNAADVVKAAGDKLDAIVDELYKASPELSSMVPKDMIKQQLTGQLSEDALLKSLTDGNSVLALNGKTVQTGAQDEFVNAEGMKMKRMYLVSGKTITTTASLNMSRDELKAMIIAQVEKMAPDQADMIKQNIDMVMNSGMMKIEASQKTTYELADDGWVKSIKEESEANSMGQNVKRTATVTIK